MNENNNMIVKWYSEDKNLVELNNATRNSLKMWEKDVSYNYFPQNARILDDGCGMGREAFNLYDMGSNITAIDISEKAIIGAKKLASESNRDITFLLTNGMDLPFEDNSFDVVIIWNQTLGLIYSESNQVAFLKECKRVLRDNGIISFSGHEREYEEMNYPHCLVGKKFFPYKNEDIYWEIFTIDELKVLAQKSGLNVLNCERGKIYREEEGTIIHCVCMK
ncbi:class I SAM-dependent methyltransferase [Clostridium estertheticum]|uniref:class I SAM-dependent methyltransferase n=1 Tax=Clostridium estertheticum TaxID=238834 RepID=UPI0013E93FFB|nr:class I SAM-dependent methyltransferase [Clostridium estertheticum]MBZ9687324.1 class I SAM-dependent methyltransferase [Clostridium estertheticum]